MGMGGRPVLFRGSQVVVGGCCANGSNDGPVSFYLDGVWGYASQNIGLRPFLPHHAQTTIGKINLSAPMRSLGLPRNPTPETA